jgi:hypothetical protein
MLFKTLYLHWHVFPAQQHSPSSEGADEVLDDAVADQFDYDPDTELEEFWSDQVKVHTRSLRTHTDLVLS